MELAAIEGVKNPHIDFDFDILKFPFLDGDVTRHPSYGVYISQLIRYARVCSPVGDFGVRNKCLNATLLKLGYRYHNLRKAFSKFYRRQHELVSTFICRIKIYFTPTPIGTRILW